MQALKNSVDSNLLKKNVTPGPLLRPTEGFQVRHRNHFFKNLNDTNS